MKSNYKRLGEYIQPVEGRNTDVRDIPLMGLSINKVFIPSIANTIGTNMATYRIIKRNQFGYGPVTSRNGEKITIALFDDYDEAMISQAYVPFEVSDTEKLLPEYLMMWFRRPEFDRYARFKSHGSAREIFSWDEMQGVTLPIPHINKQREIVAEYNTIQNRIQLNEQLTQKLEETAQAIYREWFVEGIDLENLPEGWQIKTLVDFCDIKGGKRLPKGNELNNEMNGNPYIKVADMTKGKFIVLNDSFQFVSNEIKKSISRYIVRTGDIIISIVGTIGLVNIVDSTLLNANLTENCYRLTNFKVVHSDYLYYYLVSPFGKREIESRTVGGVQAKLPMYNVQSLPIVLPKKELLLKFEKTVNPINDLQNTLTKENHKLTELKALLLSRLASV
ncbi:MAG: restriction endonuclease subunit S [Cyclobacteriaceae bacterium]|nr:restriction endonuclease subunit S [Cyclobacteriaceae bacterium]MCH8514692.1 restriction endonuclease subunit S [Cyclobacteriaceae bacterium]